MKNLLLLILIFTSCKSTLERQIDDELQMDRESHDRIKSDSTYLFQNSKQSKIAITKVSLSPIYCHVSLKNNTKETADAIRIGVLYFNDFGEPLNKTYTDFTPNYYESESKLNPNDTTTLEFDSYTDHPNAKSGVAFIQKIHYTNGTTWENSNNEDVSMMTEIDSIVKNSK